MNIEKSRLISGAAPHHERLSEATINGNEFAAIVWLFLVISVGVKPILLAQSVTQSVGRGKETSLHGSLIASLNMNFTIGHDYSSPLKLFPQIWGKARKMAWLTARLSSLADPAKTIW